MPLNSWIYDLTNPTGTGGGDGGGTGEPAPLAPNIVNATVTTLYSCPFNDSMYSFQMTLTLPTMDPNFAHLKKIRVLNSLTKTDVLVIGKPATGWTSPFTVTTDLFVQTRAAQTGTLSFNCENEDVVVTAGPVSVPFTVQASAVTGFGFVGETGTRYIDPGDIPTRLVSCTIGFVPILDGDQVPQSVYCLRSLDNGATWTGIGFQRMNTVGQQINLRSLAPGVDSTWRIAACTGALPTPIVPITAANIATLFPGVQISPGFQVLALGLPAANLISSVTVAPGTGGTYPYNTQRSDGSQYWAIPSVTVVDDPAVGVPDAFYLRVTAQDLDIWHNPCGPEQPFDGDVVNAKTKPNAYGPVVGDYGGNGVGYVRTANIAYVWFRVYLCNRVDSSEYSFQNPKCATLQMTVGGGAGYVDVAVATDGSTPPLLPDPSEAFTVTSLIAFEVGPKYQDEQQGLHTVISVIPTISADYTITRTVTVWMDFGTGDAVWQGHFALTSVAQVIRLGDSTLGTDGTRKSGDIWVPMNTAQGNWIAYCKAGRIDPGVNPVTGGAASVAFTVTPASACSPTGTTQAMFVNDPGTGDPIVYSKLDPGIWFWEYYKLTWTPPSIAQEPNYWFTLVTVQKGATIGGVWTPAPDYEGKNEDPTGHWLGRNHCEVAQLPGVANDQIAIVEKYGDKPATWTIPPGQNADLTPNLYREFRFLIYNVSRLGTDTSGSGGAGTYTLQTTCWPGGTDHYILVPQPQASSLDIRAANPKTIDLPLIGGNGQPMTVKPGAIDGTYIHDDAIQAQHMAENAITAANKALAANAVIDDNVHDVNIRKFTAGTNVFNGDVVLSRGIGKPVMVLQNDGIYLFGQADPSTGETGLTSKPYVGIQNTAIGLFQGGATGGSVYVDGALNAITIYSKNGDTTKPYFTVTSTGLTLINGSNSVGITSNAITFIDGSNSNKVDMSSAGLVLSNSSAQKLVITSKDLQLQYNSVAMVTINKDGVVVSNGGAASVTINPSQVIIVNGNLSAATITGSTITGSTVTGTTSLSGGTITGTAISGGSLSIATSQSTVSISNATDGIQLSFGTGPSQTVAHLAPTLLTLNDGTQKATLTPTAFTVGQLNAGGGAGLCGFNTVSGPNSGLIVGNKVCIGLDAVYIQSVQTKGHVFGGDFGILVNPDVPTDPGNKMGATGTFTAGTKTVTVTGGLVTSIV